MKNTFKLASGVAVAVLSLSAQAATVDLFTTGQGPYVDNTPAAGDTAPVITSGVGGSVNGADILGGNRDMFVSLIGNGGNTNREVSMGVNAGVLDFSVDTLAQGRGQIQWDGAANTDETIDFTGLAGADLTDGGALNAFALDIVFSDGGFNFEVTAYTDADSWTRISFVSNAHPVPTTTFIPFAAFQTLALCGSVNPAPGVLSITCGTDGTANLANLGALVVDLDRFGGSTSIDLTLDNVRTVPEPGVLALVGAGLLAAGFAGRRRKQA